MIALLQRVRHASVCVNGSEIARIGEGLLVFVCAVQGDTDQKAKLLAEKVLRYRIFADDAGKMNRSVRDKNGEVLVVSQFTLAADTNSGNRPSFTPAASPELAHVLYEKFVDEVRGSGLTVGTGEFGAHMLVSLINDGPATFWLEN